MSYTRRSFGRAILAFLTLTFLTTATMLLPVRPAVADDDDILTIYTARHFPADDQLYQLFTKETGIRTLIVPGKADELMQRMQLEGEDSSADIFIAGDAGTLWHAAQNGLLQPATAAMPMDHVPAGLRDTQNRWFAFSSRARIIVYDRKRVKLRELSTYEALADPKLQSDILIRPATSLDNQSMVAAMIDAIGADKTEDWVKGLVQNFARDPRGADSDQIQAVVNLEGTIAISDSYYLARMQAGKEAHTLEGLGVFFPNQHDRGAYINISGGGIATHAPHQANAVKFLDFMLSPEAQRLITDLNFEYPVRDDVAPTATIKAWGPFKSDKLRAAAMAQNNAAAINLMNQIGWR
jgi:iron(III) transport system substrate-binding protein